MFVFVGANENVRKRTPKGLITDSEAKFFAQNVEIVFGRLSNRFFLKMVLLFT